MKAALRLVHLGLLYTSKRKEKGKEKERLKVPSLPKLLHFGVCIYVWIFETRHNLA